MWAVLYGYAMSYIAVLLITNAYICPLFLLGGHPKFLRQEVSRDRS